MGQTTAIDIATNFIEERESFRASPYLDTRNVWTIGYGTTILFDGSRVSARTPPITPAIGVELLTVHIQREVLPYLQKLRNWSRLNVNQQAALISMAYNIGAPSFVEESKVAKDVEAWVPQRIPADMMNWIYETVDGKKVRSNGLINRRTDEGKLFAAPVPAGA